MTPCKYLIGTQNGSPNVVVLDHGKDLDEYLLSVGDPKKSFNQLLDAAGSIEDGLAKLGGEATSSDHPDQSNQKISEETSNKDHAPDHRDPQNTPSDSVSNGRSMPTENGLHSEPHNEEIRPEEQASKSAVKEHESVPEIHPGSSPKNSPDYTPKNSHHTDPDNGPESASSNGRDMVTGTPDASYQISRVIEPLTDLEESVFQDSVTITDKAQKCPGDSPDKGPTPSVDTSSNAEEPRLNENRRGPAREPALSTNGDKPRPHHESEDGPEMSNDPSPYWGFPRRRPVLDYTAPELPSTTPVALQEALISVVAALTTFAASIVGPQIMPESAAAMLSNVRFLEIVGAIVTTQIFAPLAAITVAGIFLLILTYQRRDLRNVRSGNP